MALTGNADTTTIEPYCNTNITQPTNRRLGVAMAQVFVTCKQQDCGAEVLAPEEAQVPQEQLASVLHKKNYYLCQKCGKVNAYTLDDHHYA